MDIGFLKAQDLKLPKALQSSDVSCNLVLLQWLQLQLQEAWSILKVSNVADDIGVFQNQPAQIHQTVSELRLPPMRHLVAEVDFNMRQMLDAQLLEESSTWPAKITLHIGVCDYQLLETLSPPKRRVYVPIHIGSILYA